jgi:hypothetical protein
LIQINGRAGGAKIIYCSDPILTGDKHAVLGNSCSEPFAYFGFRRL